MRWLWYLSINIGIFSFNDMQTPPSVTNLIDCYVKNIYFIFQYWQFLIEDPLIYKGPLKFFRGQQSRASPLPSSGRPIPHRKRGGGGACQYCRRTRTQVSNRANPMEKDIRRHFSTMFWFTRYFYIGVLIAHQYY